MGLACRFVGIDRLDGRGKGVDRLSQGKRGENAEEAPRQNDAMLITLAGCCSKRVARLSHSATLCGFCLRRTEESSSARRSISLSRRASLMSRSSWSSGCQRTRNGGIGTGAQGQLCVNIRQRMILGGMGDGCLGTGKGGIRDWLPSTAKWSNGPLGYRRLPRRAAQSWQ